jgi:TonB-linked SusC/RagA family outer membrane protein
VVASPGLCSENKHLLTKTCKIMKIPFNSERRRGILLTPLILKTMKLTTILLLFSLLNVTANSFSQNSRLSLSLKDVSIQEVLDVLEKSTDLKFLYRNESISDRKTSIKTRNASVEDILNEVFEGTGISYKLLSNNLVVIAEEELLEKQEIKITGKVSDVEGTPLPGVNVVVKGTTVGTTTDADGNFSINVPSQTAILVFSSVGYVTEEVSVGNQSVINISLVPDIKALEEVVVIGYGSQKKKDLSSAISVVDAQALQKLPVANVANALQGLSAGIEVQGNQGRPGEMPTIRIRGVASTNNTDPLFVVDGIPMDNAYINSSDIESIQVLKDAASCAIYGSRGANGVIIITTKNGKAGTLKVNYSGYYGFEKAWKQLDLLNIQQWADLVVESNTAGGTTPPPLALDIVNNRNTGNYEYYDGTNTDWQKEIFQTGAIYENNIDISGGTDKGNYYFSASQFKQEGIIIYTPYKRYSVRMNSNWQTNKFKFGENISYIYTQNRAEGTNGGRTSIEELIKITPNIPVKNPNVLGGYSGYDASLVGHDASNPVGSLARQKNMNYYKRFIGNVYGEYQIIKDLQFRSTFGLVGTEYLNTNLVLKTDMIPKSFNNTTLSETSSWTYNWVWENMLTYHTIIGNHDLTAMVAYTSEYSKYHSMGGSGTTLQTETNDILSKLESGFTVSGSENEVSRISYLGRLLYSYKGKYMLAANFRRDGSSKFGPGNKWGTFPSASIAWRLSDESFMQGISLISNLKLRASYGLVGNDAPVGPYSYISGLASGQDYVFNGTKYSGVTLTDFNNPDLTWETVKQFDAGLDIGLFKGALEITADYFDKRTEDMIISVPLPASSGSSGTINKNLGIILNNGFEFSATINKKAGDLNFSITGNLTTINNKVLDLKGAAPIVAGDVEFGQCTKTDSGYSVGEFYGYKMLGVFPDQQSIDAYTHDGQLIQPDAKPGDIKWADLNNDGVITSDDRYFMGSPIPKLTYGLNANFAYKGIDLSFFFQGVYGNKIYAELVCWTQGMQNNFNAGTAVLDRWTPSNTNTNIPRAVRNDPNGNINKISDRYIKDGSYLRLKNISLGYTLPKSIVNKVNISNLRVYVTGRNLLTFTKYPFYDPEIGSNAVGVNGTINTSRGIDNGYYPQARTIIMGIQVGF